MADQPAYTPAADGSDWRDKPPNVMATDAQWLQRLLDSERPDQLEQVRQVRAAAETGWLCDQMRHKEVIGILRSHSIDKTHTIRRLEHLLSQEQTKAEDAPAPDPETPVQTAS